MQECLKLFVIISYVSPSLYLQIQYQIRENSCSKKHRIKRVTNKSLPNKSI